jgi:sec-independent protein translocase protein TatC
MDPDLASQGVAAPPASGFLGRLRPRRPHLRLPFRRPPQPERPLEMTLVGHLVELRNRLIISFLSLIPGTIVGFVFAGDIIRILKAPLPEDKPLIALGVAEPFFIDMQIAITVGIILAMPVILYQLWAYVSPGLTRSERAAARPWVPLALLFFALGVCVAYFILPYATAFLFAFQTPDLQIMLTAESYFGFVTSLFLVFGLAMEFPIVLVLLSKVGLITSARLRKSRRTAILVLVIVASVITPGGDLVSPIVMAVVLIGLYEASIVMIRMGGH